MLFPPSPLCFSFSMRPTIRGQQRKRPTRFAESIPRRWKRPRLSKYGSVRSIPLGLKPVHCGLRAGLFGGTTRLVKDVKNSILFSLVALNLTVPVAPVQSAEVAWYKGVVHAHANWGVPQLPTTSPD